MWPGGLTYWVSNINTQDSSSDISGIEGGVILSNADRQIAELTEIRKRSGPILSARNAAVFLEFFRENKIDLKHIFCTLRNQKQTKSFKYGITHFSKVVRMGTRFFRILISLRNVSYFCGTEFTAEKRKTSGNCDWITLQRELYSPDGFWTVIKLGGHLPGGWLN